MVRSEENRRTTMLREAGSERSTVISNRRAVVVTETGPQKSEMASNRGGGSRMKARGEFQSRAANKVALWCTFGNKPRHTRETCFKLHGKEVVLNYLGSFKNLAAKI